MTFEQRPEEHEDIWISSGKSYQAEGTANAEVLSQEECVPQSKKASVVIVHIRAEMRGLSSREHCKGFDVYFERYRKLLGTSEGEE